MSRKKNKPIYDIDREFVREPGQDKTLNVTLTIDANPNDELSGLKLTFLDVSNSGFVQSLLGMPSANGRGMDPNLATLIDLTNMIECEFTFQTMPDGMLAGRGCYFCDDNLNGVIDSTDAPRKCGSNLTASSSAADNTPGNPDGILYAMLVGLGHGQDFVF